MHNYTITKRSSEPKQLPIDTLIEYLKDEKKRGAKSVLCFGTLITEEHNSVLMTNEPQW